MNVEIQGGNSFSHLQVQLEPGQGLRAEPGAMASMDVGIDMISQFNGGFFAALLIQLLGKESIFINTYKNLSNKTQSLVLSKNGPGQIIEQELKDEVLYIQAGSYIASSPGVKHRLSWAGFASWLGGEGLFRLRVYGTGRVWYGAFGAVVEREVRGEYIVDSGHLLSYPDSMSFSVEFAGGLIKSFLSGEGLVLRLRGQGRIRLQTRSLKGLTSWLNSRFMRLK